MQREFVLKLARHEKSRTQPPRKTARPHRYSWRGGWSKRPKKWNKTADVIRTRRIHLSFPTDIMVVARLVLRAYIDAKQYTHMHSQSKLSEKKSDRDHVLLEFPASSSSTSRGQKRRKMMAELKIIISSRMHIKERCWRREIKSEWRQSFFSFFLVGALTSKETVGKAQWERPILHFLRWVGDVFYFFISFCITSSHFLVTLCIS